MLHEAKIAYCAFDTAILFATTIGLAVAKATWRHCLSHFIDRVAARTCWAVNVLTSRISFLFSWPWWMGSVVKHNMLKCSCQNVRKYVQWSRVVPCWRTDGRMGRQTWRSQEYLFAIFRTRLKKESLFILGEVVIMGSFFSTVQLTVLQPLNSP